MIAETLLAISLAGSPGVRCAENLPRCPANGDGVVFCGAEYPCLADDRIKARFEHLSNSGRPEYAYALYIYQRWDNGDEAAAIGWLRQAAKADFFYSRFELAEYEFRRVANVDVGSERDKALEVLKSSARGDLILEGRLGAILAQSSGFEDQGLLWLKRSVRRGNARALPDLVELFAATEDVSQLDYWCGVYEIVSAEIDAVPFTDCSGLEFSRSMEQASRIGALARSIVGKWSQIKKEMDQCLELQSRHESSEFGSLDPELPGSNYEEGGPRDGGVGCAGLRSAPSTID